MAINQKTINYAVEVDTLFNVLTVAITDIKLQKPLTTVLGDLLPGIISAVSQIGELSAELSANKIAVEDTVALRVVDLINALTA